MRAPALSLIALLLCPASATAHDWNGLAADAAGVLYAVDAEDGQVWKIDAAGAVSVYVKGIEDRKTCRHTHHVVLDGDGVLWMPSG